MSVFYQNPERGTMPYSGRGSIGTPYVRQPGGGYRNYADLVKEAAQSGPPDVRMVDGGYRNYADSIAREYAQSPFGTPYVRQPGGGYRNYADLVKEAAQSGPPDVRMVDGGYRNYADSIAREYAQSPFGGGGIPAQQQNWMGLLAELYNLRSPRWPNREGVYRLF